MLILLGFVANMFNFIANFASERMKMHILLSNDDGYLAEGLVALAEALRVHADITVVAPDRNRSAASNSLTLEGVRAARRSQTLLSSRRIPT